MSTEYSEPIEPQIAAGVDRLFNHAEVLNGRLLKLTQPLLIISQDPLFTRIENNNFVLFTTGNYSKYESPPNGALRFNIVLNNSAEKDGNANLLLGLKMHGNQVKQIELSRNPYDFFEPKIDGFDANYYSLRMYTTRKTSIERRLFGFITHISYFLGEDSKYLKERYLSNYGSDEMLYSNQAEPAELEAIGNVLFTFSEVLKTFETNTT